MARKFYFSSSASRPLVREGREFKFVALSIVGGRVSGVFDSDDPVDIAILDRAVQAKIGVTELTAEQADHAKKKLGNSPQRSALLSNGALQRPRLASSPVGALLPGVPVTGAGSAESAAAKADIKPTGEITIPTVISMVKVGHVRPPQPFVAEGERMTIRGKK